MAIDYEKADKDKRAEIEKLFNGNVIFSSVEGVLKEIHIKLPDNKSITVSRSYYGEGLDLLVPVRQKVYIAKFNVILQDDSVEEVTKEFATEEERDRYVNLKLTHQQSEEVKLLEREIG